MDPNPHAACLLFLAISLATGCSGAHSTGDATPAASKPAATASSTAESPADQLVTATVAKWAGVEQFIAQQKGKVVVVDIWSTSCVPCIREFPGLVKLHNQYRATGKLACVSVNADFYGDGDGPSAALQKQVREFLAAQKASFTNFISSDVDETVFMKAGAPSIPIVLVYDASGKLAERFVESKAKYGATGFTYEKHINPLVAKLVEGSHE